MEDLHFLCEGPHRYHQLTRNLLEVIENQHNAFFHSICEGTLHILELSEFLSAHEIAKEGVQLDSSIDPKLNILVGICGREIVSGGQTIAFGYLYFEWMDQIALGI